MKAPALAEGVLWSHLQASWPSSLQCFPSSSTAFRLPQMKLKPASRNWRLRPTRYSRQRHHGINFDFGSLQHFPGIISDYISDFDLHYPNSPFKELPCGERYMTEVTARDDANASASCQHEKNAIFCSSLGICLRLATVFGLIIFQGSPEAHGSEMQSLAKSGFSSMIQPYVGDLGDISTGFASASLLIFFSELGDKTFFIAALLAARNSSAIIFTGTFGALAAMTIVSVVLGRTFHYIDDVLPFRIGGNDLPLDDIAAVCLLMYFGVSTLLEAASDDGLKADEEQKEAELAVSKFSGNGAGIIAATNTLIGTFLLVFVAEWGDKSFFSTIALAAATSPLGVIGGALAGHAAATLIAVLGGSLLGAFLSEKAIAYIGGTLFLVFAAVTLFEIAT